jgi:hypothetical protein
MKMFHLCAALGVAFAAPVAAFAAPTDHSQMSGHYEWRSAPQHGPHAPLQAPQRVWVPDSTQAGSTQTANCDCAMMKKSAAAAADCMKGMHGMASPSGASAS